MKIGVLACDNTIPLRMKGAFSWTRMVSSKGILGGPKWRKAKGKVGGSQMERDTYFGFRSVFNLFVCFFYVVFGLFVMFRLVLFSLGWLLSDMTWSV